MLQMVELRNSWHTQSHPYQTHNMHASFVQKLSCCADNINSEISMELLLCNKVLQCIFIGRFHCCLCRFCHSLLRAHSFLLHYTRFRWLSIRFSCVNTVWTASLCLYPMNRIFFHHNLNPFIIHYLSCIGLVKWKQNKIWYAHRNRQGSSAANVSTGK